MIKIVLQKFLFFRFRSCKIDQFDPVFLDLLHQAFVCRVFSLVQALHFLQDRLDLLFRGHLRLAVPDLFVEQHLVLQRAYAHHEELVQIVLIDRDEVHSLTQRDLLIFCFLQHSLIKFQPGKLSVHINVSHFFLLCT